MQSPSQDSRFRRIYEEHRSAITAYCLRRASRSDAMDAVAETFAVAWRRIDRLPGGGAERSWLYAGDSVAEAEQAGTLRGQYADEWAAYLDANGCTYQDPDC
ncbi:MAG: sigma factor [Acidimicrobiia bacterium]